MIDFDSVSFAYGEKKVFSGFSMHIADGDRVCLFSGSGKGKTTALRLIMGLVKADSGSVNVGSTDISAVFQEDRLLPFKTVIQNASMFAAKSMAYEMLSRLGLGNDVDKYPSELSGGMARRTALARALAADRDIYIFDEPFDGLDAESITAAINLINERTKDKTIILVSHDRTEAERLGCRIIEI